jgi:hypothetical protein
MRQAYAHEAVLVLRPDGDERAHAKRLVGG